MPTERFYRLPEEKKEVIRKAALKEFTRVVPEEASINKVIHDADISRGSFYTYFDSKYDLLKWLFSDKVKKYQYFYVNDLKENGGNIWLTFEKALEASMNHAFDGGFIGIIENLMESKTFPELFKQELEAEDDSEICCSRRTYLEGIYQLLNRERYPMDYIMFSDLMEMHLIVIMLSFKRILKDKEPVDKVQRFYSRRMELLRFGAETRNMNQNN